MTPRAWLLGLVCLAGCRAEPSWARASEGASGEATLTGAPLEIPAFGSRPNLDGKPDEPLWRTAALLAPLVEPGSGAARTDHPVAGWARLGWDAEHLYCAIVVRDRAPHGPFARDAIDPHIWAQSSGVELMIQPGDPGDN